MANNTKTKNGNGSFTCHFNLWKEKETKGTHRYQQVSADGAPYDVQAGAEFGSLYIRKSAFKNGAPEKITVTVEGK